MKVLQLSLMASLAIASSLSPARADAPADNGSEYTVTKTIHIGGEGRWDYITADPKTHRLFVPRSSHTQIIDADAGTVLGDIPDTQSCHGVALAPDANRGFVSDRNGVTVFDLTTLKPLGNIAAGTGPDAIIYDPASKCVVVMNGRSNDASFIDASAPIDSAKATTIPLDGKPEFAASDGNGKVFINIEDKSEIAVIDTKQMKLVDRWKIAPGDGPSGLAIDPVHHHLFSGCHNKMMAVIDTETGKVVATIPIGSGVDACVFDPETNQAFASCGDGTTTVANETSPNTFDAHLIKTPLGARTIAIDTATQTLYLPAAEMLPSTQPATPGVRQRPTMKPNSFMIVVVAHAPPAK